MNNKIILSTSTVLASLCIAGCGETSRGEIKEMSCTDSIPALTKQQLESTIKDRVSKICGGVNTLGHGDRYSEVKAPVTVLIGESGKVHFIQSNIQNLLKDPLGFSKK